MIRRISLVLYLVTAPIFAGAAGLASAADEVSVVIDAAKRRPEISPFIYGQFIEHLGRCIYGGIWAEMLEDRKFYFPIEKNYDPYKSLQDTAFPVVGASPWEIIGDPGGVVMTTEAPFVGEQTPQVAAGSGLRQHDLGVVAGKSYVGYIWLKAAEDGAGPVEMALVCGDESAKRQTHQIDQLSGEYQKFDFTFTADATTDKGMFEIKVQGNKPVLIGTASLMPGDNVRGMRADTLQLLKQLHAPLYRWPGGNFVSGYEWRDGIGDRDRRPPRKNPAWTGVEHNDVGLDEFIAFCREVGAEPMVAANTGFGDDYSAAQEVEYCNGGPETIGGSWRIKNGHAEPYRVTHWCVGNEMFGAWQLGYMALDQYALKHNRVARAMRQADPSLVLVGVGNIDAPNDSKQKITWSEGMLRDCHESMDMISEHFYEGRTPWGGKTPDAVSGHAAMLRNAIRTKAVSQRALQRKLGLWPDKMVPIAMDEWNYWHKDYVYGELGCQYDLADALGVAAGLHEYFRNTDIIHMANYAQTVNVIGCIKTTKTQAFMDTTALPLMVYREHFGTTPVEAICSVKEDQLDVCAAVTSDGRAITIGAVNPSKDAVVVDLQLDGVRAGDQAHQWSVSGDDPGLTNEPDNARVEIQESDVPFDGTWKVPGYGFTVLRVSVE